APSMMAPSTMLSGGTGSMANATTLKPFPTAFSSTALTELDPMSSPTTAFFDLPRPNTGYVLTELQTSTFRKADTRAPRQQAAWSTRRLPAGTPIPFSYRPNQCSRLQLLNL